MTQFPLVAMFSGWISAFSGLSAAAFGGSWDAAFHESFPEEDRGRVAIASPDVALTFARMDVDGRPRVLLVTTYDKGIVTGVDLSTALARNVEDPVALFAERGYEALLGDLRDAPPSAQVTVAVAKLLVPVDFGDQHIAVGTNYPEHASDAGTTRPFLFPKLVQPGTSGDAVSVHGGLLDYEVEIAAMTLEPLAVGDSPRFLGLLVSNDFTDRETLMHHVDRDDIESGKGFTTGKSFPGYLPVGSLLVVPRNWRTFVSDLELRLFVNDGLRQRSKASEMVWNVEEVFRQIAVRRGVLWEYDGREVPLWQGDAIPARTLVLTGTPHGTVFQGMPGRLMLTGLLRWLFGGWGTSIPDQVIGAYVDDARDARAYLQPGDEVLIHVQHLGEIRSRVVP